MPPRGPLPLWYLCGLLHRHSAPALLSKDALPADTNQLTLSTSEDGCQINPHSRDVKLKKKDGKKTQKKVGGHLPNQQFSAGFPETLQAFKTKRGEKTKPLYSDEVQKSDLTSKAFLLASYSQILAQSTRKPVGSATLLPDDSTQPAGV